jgi:eukaryotic-like serine/threonine-protein kinase
VTNPAPLAASLAGRYTIDREIGRGGMATVFLARDVKHSRPVALKILNPELGAVLGVDRFLAEIRVTANLQHPNLLPLFDSGETDGTLFYVMPFVDGESLRDRLSREKQLPVAEAIHIATAVASALDYAHRHGVIHRDLKPENILLHEGQPLVADFGIALAVSNAGGTRVTQTGISLGTPQYMSPEQGTGDRAIDGRTDVYSLGAVLYEMLTGDPPHLGGTAQAIISKVLTERPRPIRSARPAVPSHVDRSVLRALEKLPADRFATAQEFSEALAGRALSLPETTTAETQAATPPQRKRWVLRAGVGVAVVALAALAGIGWIKALRRSPPPTTRYALDIPERERFTMINGVPVVFSPDGRAVVYAGAGGPGTRQLYYRRLDELAAHALPGTEDSSTPFFSADGKTVAFSKGLTLYMVPIAGGTPRMIANGSFRSPSWTSDGTIYFGTPRGLGRIRPGQQAPESLTEPDSTKSELGHGTPIVGPDGNTIIYWVRASARRADHLALLKLDTKESRDIEGDAVNALGVLDGYLIFGRQDGTLNAIRYDPRTLRSLTDAVPVLEGVATRSTGGVAASISRDGSLVYVRGGATSQLVVTDESGNKLAGTTEPREFVMAAFSPDGKRIAVTAQQEGGLADVWIYDLSTSILSRLTSDAYAFGQAALSWTHDGTRVAFVKNPATVEVWWAMADGSRPPEKVATLPQPVRATTFAPDGQSAVVNTGAPLTELWRLPLGGDRKATPMYHSGFEELNPAISPDGKWIAYASNVTGRLQIYLRPFPGPGGAIQITATPTSANNPQWMRDGRLIFRIGDSLTVVTLTKGPAPTVAQQRTLFAVPGNYTVSPDGKRFAFVRPTGGDQQVVVVLNWLNDLRAKLAAAGKR